MASAIINTTGGTGPAHLRGFHSAIIIQSDKMPDYSRYIAKVMTTDQIAEEILWLSGLATAQKRRESGSVFYDSLSVPKRKSFTTEEWSIGVEMSGKMIRTDQTGKLKRMATEFARSHYNSRQRMVADIINFGTTAGYTGIDGVVLFSASHPSASSTFSNLSTQASIGPDMIAQMLADVHGHLTWKDEPFIPDGGDYWAVYHPAQEFAVGEALSSTLKAHELSNTKNMLGSLSAGTVKAMPRGHPFLVDTNALTLIPANTPIFRLVGQEMETRITETEDFTTKYGSNRDETTGWTMPHGVQHNLG